MVPEGAALRARWWGRPAEERVGPGSPGTSSAWSLWWSCWSPYCSAASGLVSVTGGVTAKVPAHDTVGQMPASQELLLRVPPLGAQLPLIVSSVGPYRGGFPSALPGPFCWGWFSSLEVTVSKRLLSSSGSLSQQIPPGSVRLCAARVGSLLLLPCGPGSVWLPSVQPSPRTSGDAVSLLFCNSLLTHDATPVY